MDKRRRPGRPVEYTEPRKRINMELPAALIEEIDRLATNRTQFIEQALRKWIDDLEQRRDATQAKEGHK